MSGAKLTLDAVHEFARARSRGAAHVLPAEDDWAALDEHFGRDRTWDDDARDEVWDAFRLGWTEGRSERPVRA